MKKTLYLLSGLPGSGKSTWAARLMMAAHPETAIWHSRDKIRFGLLGETDNYFACEDKVVSLWHKGLQASLDAPFIKVIIADATHLSDRSRNRTLKGLNLPTGTEVINVVFDVPIEVCKERNAKREGRERVPDSAIDKMFKAFKMPNNGYKTIVINEEGEKVNG